MSRTCDHAISDALAMEQLLDRIAFADQVGLDYFGIGEHHRKGFLDSAPTLILAAAAAQTKNIRLGTAVTVLSAADPVRVFQQHATLDLISGGRAEMVAGRGSFIDAYPLFGLDLNDYDALFIEKLDLLLKIRDNETISWSGKFRPALKASAVSFSHLAGRRRNTFVICKGGYAWTSIDGGHHRWRDPSLQAAG